LTAFETDKKQLTFLLDQIHQRELALPDFQRDFVWDPNATRELIRSVMQGYPAGALLLLQGGASVFAPRPVAGAPDLAGTPSYLALDGQQRLTSMYQALFGVGTHRYFLNLRELLDGEDIDEAVEVFQASKAARWDSLNGQAKDLMLPLAHLRKYALWCHNVINALGEDGLTGDARNELQVQLIELGETWVKPVEQYQFPVVTLGLSTPTEAVCTIFETLNRTGVKLGVFDLLAARGFAQEVHLRDMWDKAHVDHPILADFRIDPYYVLQVIALTCRGNPKRGVVLDLKPVEEIAVHWDAAIRGIAGSLGLLREECGVLSAKWLPYGTMLVTLGAVWPEVEKAKGPGIGAARSKLKRWFWAATFAQRYENQVNTRSETDTTALIAWLRGDGPEPGVLAEPFDPQQWRDITPRQTALYKASMAMLMSNAPLDFHKGQPLTPTYVAEAQVDDHHVFPSAYLADIGASPELRAAANTILNRTLIDKITNIRIGKRAPSDYLTEIGTELGEDHLRAILASHNLPDAVDGALRTDSFEAFLDWRLERLIEILQAKTGWDFGDAAMEVTWAKETSGDGRDFTRYHIIADGHESPDLNKRGAIREMVNQLVAHGISPAQIKEVMPPRALPAIPGIVIGEADVQTQLVAHHPNADVRRHWTDTPYFDEEASQTYVLFKMWGMNTEPTLSALVEAFQATGVSFRVAD
jgi:hypothetical protein